jgi:NAD-dependent deacetylase
MAKPNHIVILTGAGISAESGIETFRSEGGLWEQYPIEQVATPEGFAKDPALVHHFYNMRRAALKTVKPNPAHKALAELQTYLRAKDGQLTLITQNVDDLHSRAGAKEVIHMHGILTSLKCQFCDVHWEWTEDASHDMTCPACYVKTGPRPDIVWFDEMPYYLEQIESAMQNADLFVSIGTSGAVYPAAGLVSEAKRHGIPTLELNLEPSQVSALFDESRLGKAGTIVPQWVSEIIDQ